MIIIFVGGGGGILWTTYDSKFLKPNTVTGNRTGIFTEKTSDGLIHIVKTELHFTAHTQALKNTPVFSQLT
jgi:hypothetical protein